MSTTEQNAIDPASNGHGAVDPSGAVTEAEVMTPPGLSWPRPGNGKSASAAPHRMRLAEVGILRKVHGRIFHAAFYSEDELTQIADFIRFDRDYYLAEYPDVAINGLDPVRHFLAQGINEMRLPSSPGDAPGGDWLRYLLGFDAAYYQALYPDTTAAQHEHFMQYGAREHRIPFNLHENLASEQLLMEILDTLGIICPGALEEPGRHEADAWRAVPDALLAHVEQNGIVPKPYRNNFWLGMAVGLLAQCRFGAAACCYNFFFNYYIPVAFLGNADAGMIGAGCIFTTIEGIARSGTVVATPQLAGSATINEPTFLNRPNRALPPSSLPLPQPVYGILPNVEAIGGTSLMIQNAHVALYDYMEYGERARELQCPNLLHVVGQNCSFRVPVATLAVSEAYSMLHDHGHNYHHWLLEIVPRYLLARQNGLPASVPLLVAKGIPPQMREVLHQACRGEPALIEVAAGASVHVQRLHVSTDISINTVHTEDEPERGDILFSPSAVAMIREIASPFFADPLGKYENVLIVRQNVEFRRLINRDALLKSMKSLGLWSFDPGSAIWADQVRVFSNARLIVSEAGAALANLVFCRPGAVVIVLVNGHKNSNYFFLTQLDQLVGARLYFFECLRLAGSHSIGVQDDMIAPVGQLADWVRRFLADPEFRPFATGATTGSDGDGEPRPVAPEPTGFRPERHTGGRKKKLTG